jgi:hypothetical protein
MDERHQLEILLYPNAARAAAFPLPAPEVVQYSLAYARFVKLPYVEIETTTMIKLARRGQDWNRGRRKPPHQWRRKQ